MTDYIRTYLGLMGSGKTTQAMRDVEASKRLIVYSPGSTNPALHPSKIPYVYDSPEYMKNLGKHLERTPRLRVEKKVAQSDFFRVASQFKSYSFLLDDIAALKTTPQERSDFEAFIRTVRYNGNQVIITTHRARKDLPPLVLTIGTSFYYVGAGTRFKREIDTLYELTNYPITYQDFAQGLMNNAPMQIQNGRIVKPAGIFTIRKA